LPHRMDEHFSPLSWIVQELRKGKAAGRQ